MTPWRQVDRRGLAEFAGDDPYPRCEVGPDAVGLVLPGAGWAALVNSGTRCGAYAVLQRPLSETEATQLVTDVQGLAADRGWRMTFFSATDGHPLPLGPEWQGETRWVWMSTDQLSPGLDDWQLVELDDDADAEELTAFALPINPIWEGDPGQGRNRFWLGARDSTGALLGCGTVHETANGFGHLAGIVVDPAVRGLGLGLAITLGLSERVLATDGRTTLSAYAHNTSAISVYLRAGYHLDHRFHSRWTEPRRPS